MGFLVLLAGILVAFSPLIAVFILYLRHKGQLIILSIGSSFFWLLSFLCSALFWFMIPPLRAIFLWSIPASVLFQEGARYMFWRLYTAAERGRNSNEAVRPRSGEEMSSPSSSDAGVGSPVPRTLAQIELEQLQVALATGVGMAGIHGAIIYGTVIWEARGPGTLFSSSCPTFSVFYISGLFTLLFVLMHLFASLIGFEAYKTGSRLWIGLLYAAHLGLALTTVLNQTAACGWSLFLAVPIVAGLGFFAIRLLLRYTIPLRRRLYLQPEK